MIRTIMLVDDKDDHRIIFQNYLDTIGFSTKGASNASEALELLRQERIDLVVSEIKIKGKDGLELMNEAHRNYPDIPFIIMTGYVPEHPYEDIIGAGASDFIAKPFSMGELIAKIYRIQKEKYTLLQLKRTLIRTKKIFENTVGALVSTLEKRDPYTAGHQRRVADLASAIGRELGFAEEKIEGLRLASFVHDIGKIGIPSEILANPGRLNETEISMIKEHPRVGHDILQRVEFPWPIAETVFQHHERLDGSGYPQGLVGRDILAEAKIIGVADVVEAMSAYRPYRPELDLSGALEEISKNKGILYDREIVDACIRLFNEKDFKFVK